MDELFSKDVVNSGRQKELDLAKGFAIILMVFCHVGIYFYEEGTTGYFITDLIGCEFAAPVFMICLGVGVVYSSHNSVKELIKRGLLTLFFAYLLNFVREGIFVIIGNIIDKPYSPRGMLEAMMLVDIMHFAGLAFIVLALFKKFKVSPVQQFMIGMLCAGLGEILAWKSTGNLLLDNIFGLIWGTYGNTFFPILNWIIFPISGVCFGHILMHCKDKSKLYKSVFLIGLAGVILSYYQFFVFGHDVYYNNYSYYFMGIKNVVYALCYPIVMFSICQFIADKTIIEDLPIVSFCSINLNKIYCVSWVIILGSRYLIYDVLAIYLSDLTIVGLMFVTLFVSYEIVKVYVGIKGNKRAVSK